MFPNRLATAYLPFVLLCVCPGVLPGQEFPKEPDREMIALGDKVGQFFKDIAAGETQTAYQQLLDKSQLAEKDHDKALADLIEKTKEVATRYGEYRGAEQVDVKRVGTEVVLLKYLYKCKNFPVVWYFAFYRTGGATPAETATWRVVSVRFDTNLEVLWF